MTYTLAPWIPIVAAGGESGGHGIAEPALSHWLWTWIIFALVFLLLRKFAWKPLREQLEAREKRIQDTVDKADQVKSEAETLLDTHRELMDRAKSDAQEIINEGRTAAERIQQEAEKVGESEARTLVDRAKKEIDLQTKKALEEIRRETVDLTIIAASQVLQRSIDDEDHRRLTADVIEEIQRTEGD
jgi:F-type H+-transporting ATPase subunit b